MKLYEVADAIEYILANKVDHDTGELTEETLIELDALEMERDAKCLAIAAYLKGELAEADAIKAEAAKLASRAQGHTNRAKRLHEYLMGNLPQDAPKISDARSVIGWRKNPASVEITDEAAIPKRLLRVVPETTAPDKKAILDDLKAKRAVPGARLVQKMRLEIK